MLACWHGNLWLSAQLKGWATKELLVDSVVNQKIRTAIHIMEAIHRSWHSKQGLLQFNSHIHSQSPVFEPKPSTISFFPAGSRHGLVGSFARLCKLTPLGWG